MKVKELFEDEVNKSNRTPESLLKGAMELYHNLRDRYEKLNLGGERTRIEERMKAQKAYIEKLKNKIAKQK